MTFHVVSLPHTQTTKNYVHCAYTEKVRKFCTMMKSLGHTVYLYASEDNEAQCDELITCITKDQQKEMMGIEKPTDNLNMKFDPNEPYWKLMNANAIIEIGKRKQPKDFICVIAGLCQKEIADAHADLMNVEFGIGYGGVFSKYKVFESYAWMHMVYGNRIQDIHQANGVAYDRVIPNYYELNDFPFEIERDHYFLYIGRLIERKGLSIAVETCKKLGAKLVVAGQGTPPEGVDYRGVVGVAERGKLMSKALATFVPTLYIEPFGGVAAESMLCGTPVITTDWGAFTETVQQGFDGYRCRTFQDFVNAALKAPKLNNYKIRDHAQQRFSTEHVKLQYEKYFQDLLTLWDKGWYTLREEVK